MSPPCFADIGKQAKDLFNKNYHMGIVKLDMKTKTDGGVEFTVNGTSNNDTGRVNASLETKKFISEYGITFKEKWTTDNVLNTEVTVEDKMLKGLKLGGVFSYAPQSGKTNGTLKGAFKNDFTHVSTDVDVDYAGYLGHCAFVLGRQGFMGGGQLSYDITKRQLTKINFGAAYQTPDYVLSGNYSDGQDFSASVYHRLNENCDHGVQVGWSSANNTTRFAVGTVYRCDHDTSIRAKVNKDAQIGLGFTHRLRRGISLTVCAQLDAKNLNQGGHKLGLGVDLEA